MRWVQGWSSERGAATALVVGVCAVVLGLGLGGVLVASASQAGSTARHAADLGSLAGATVLMDRLRGVEEMAEPCAAAASVVAHNGAVQESCVIDGSVNITVRARVELSGPLRRIPGLSAVTGAARAGPATEREQLR